MPKPYDRYGYDKQLNPKSDKSRPADSKEESGSTRKPTKRSTK